MVSEEKSKINCPKCGEEIDVNDILYHQVDEQLKRQYSDELAKEKAKYESQASILDEERHKLELEKRKQDEEIEKLVNEDIKKREIELRKKLKAEADNEQSEAFNTMREELNEKSIKIRELNKATVELEKVKREKNELADSIKAESEK